MSIGVGKNIPVKIVATSLDTASTGTECILVQVENEDGVQYWRGWLGDASLERTIDTLRDVGWDAEKYDHDIESLDGTDLLVGNDARITTESEVYEGKPRIKVAWLNGMGYKGKGISDESKASLRARIKALGGARPAVAEKPKADEAGPIEVDDTPF